MGRAIPVDGVIMIMIRIMTMTMTMTMKIIMVMIMGNLSASEITLNIQRMFSNSLIVHKENTKKINV